jgi:hypothetical protein
LARRQLLLFLRITPLQKAQLQQMELAEDQRVVLLVRGKWELYPLQFSLAGI